jgi:hypothetical protein
MIRAIKALEHYGKIAQRNTGHKKYGKRTASFWHVPERQDGEQYGSQGQGKTDEPPAPGALYAQQKQKAPKGDRDKTQR